MWMTILGLPFSIASPTSSCSSNFSILSFCLSFYKNRTFSMNMSSTLSMDNLIELLAPDQTSNTPQFRSTFIPLTTLLLLVRLMALLARYPVIASIWLSISLVELLCQVMTWRGFQSSNLLKLFLLEREVAETFLWDCVELMSAWGSELFPNWLQSMAQKAFGQSCTALWWTCDCTSQLFGIISFFYWDFIFRLLMVLGYCYFKGDN